MVKVLQLLLLFMLSLFIHGSENASPIQLLNFANKLDTQLSEPLWFKSAMRGNVVAANKLLASAKQKNNAYWLAQIARLPAPMPQIDNQQNETDSLLLIVKSEAAFTLAMQSKDEREQIYWFTQASNFNDPRGQFELSLLLKDDKKRLSLLTASANSAYAPAIITLAKYYRQNLIIASPASNAASDQSLSREKSQNLALHWLQKAAVYDGTSAFDLGLLQWQLGKPAESRESFKLAANSGSSKGADYLAALSNQLEISINELFLPNSTAVNYAKSNACAQQLQFVGSDLQAVVRANQIKTQFEQDERFNDISICINAVAWVPPESLLCRTQSVRNRIKCDLSAFAEVMQTPAFTHLVVFAQAGKAYVQRGVMYLDQADQYSVFVHELAHFASFVDEYALSSPLANIQCAAKKAPNLIVEDELGQLDQTKIQLWQNASAGSLSISLSKTCSRLDKVSFKPSADITFLEHHDTDNIPPLYLQLWQQQINKHPKYIEVAREFLHIAQRNQLDDAIVHWHQLQSADNAQLK